MIQTVKIPIERLGALIGKNGETKDRLERVSGVKLGIDSDEGDVTIDATHAADPSMAIAVSNVVVAIGRGFSPQKAMLLLQDSYYIEIFDIRDYVGKRKDSVTRMRARVIGSGGKTRQIVEELTGAFMSVFGNTVALIGDDLQLEVAKRAVEMILCGSEHAAVYHFLEGSRARLKVEEMGY